MEALSAAGMGILYTTHYMEEAERLCDRVGIIDEGRIIAEGTRRELVALVGELDTVMLSASGDLAGAAAAARGSAGRPRGDARMTAASTCSSSRRDGCCRSSSPRSRSDGVTIRSVEVVEPDLEAVFLHLTGKALRD